LGAIVLLCTVYFLLKGCGFHPGFRVLASAQQGNITLDFQHSTFYALYYGTHSRCVF